MSTTGGRNRKRSDVNRTATRRPSTPGTSSEDQLDGDERTRPTDEPHEAGGSRPSEKASTSDKARTTDEAGTATGTKTATTAKASGSTAVGSAGDDTATEGAVVTKDATDGDAADGAKKKPRRGRKAKADGEEKPEKPLSERAQRREAKKAMRMGNPAWFIPVMLGLFILGLVWIVVFYLSQMMYPIPHIQYWNLAIGFGLLMLGFAMTTRWK